MPVFEITSFRGGLSEYEDKGIAGSFKFGSNLDIRKKVDSLTCQQALEEEGLVSSASPSASPSPSPSPSASPSVSVSLSPSLSPSYSGSASPSPSPSATPSVSASPSLSPSLSPSASASPSSSPSPSPSPSQALISVFRDLIRWLVKASDGYTYGFGSTGYIYRRDADAVWLVVYKDPDGAIKGAEEKPSSSGKTYLYWCNNTKLKRKELPGLANWNDVSTVAQDIRPATWHTEKQVGGALHIANDKYLALVGYDDSYTNNSLDLIPGNIATTLVERNGRVIVGTARVSDPDRSVNAAIDAEIPLAQIGDDGEIFYADMRSSMPVHRFPGGGIVNPGGVANEIEQVNFFEWEDTALSWLDKQSVGNMALFGVYSADANTGGVYKYGRKFKNHPFVLNLDYQFDADEIGAMTNINGTTIFSYQDGTDFGVKAVNPDAKATGTYEGLDLKAPSKLPAKFTSWKYVKITCKPLPDGSSIEFQYKLNKAGGWVAAKDQRNSTKFTAANETEAVFFMGDEANIFEPRLILTPTGNSSPEVLKIQIFFDYE